MKRRLLAFSVALFVVLGAVPAWAITPTEDELGSAYVPPVGVWRPSEPSAQHRFTPESPSFPNPFGLMAVLAASGAFAAAGVALRRRERQLGESSGTPRRRKKGTAAQIRSDTK